MSLRPYQKRRLVVLDPKASALEAARALQNNNIGAILVQDRGPVAGIVTDRDLAIRVVGAGRDPKSTRIEEVMTSPVIAISPAGSEAEAIKLMRQRNVRRIPLVEGDRIAGIVTIDDLLLNEAAPLSQLAEVVQAQIGEGGPAPLNSPRLERRAARAEAAYRRLLNQVRTQSGLEDADQADAALDIVLSALVRRLTPGEAKDLIAQLPSLLHPALYALQPGPDKLVTREAIERQLARELEVDPGRASQLLAAIGGVISQNVSAGQMDDVRGQLPEELRGVFSEAA